MTLDYPPVSAVPIGPVRPPDEAEVRHAAVVILAAGLDVRNRPGGLRDPAPDIARDVAEALGLIPTPEPTNPRTLTPAERAAKARTR